ncbi:aldo/keto reductase [Tsukamurella sp. 8F]|uniref:aldo/keto reductase n=1 Tax=unclassified Tsukamurella TaxID=2633480 RepID=UPI0023B99EC5|nr:MULTISPECIES: aldo/keto reductase [unclassified Tsukamurella]MDF0529538.1 aldo/keto reductase [Tsukamurella sp. 8J]MDF0585774.1 aldo/keto reductase [Tsukamurella sp. 8F]
MEYRTLGRSGTAVSEFGLGTMTFGDTTPKAEAFEQLDLFIEAGGTLIDTADVYARGVTEEIIGEWLRRSGATTTDRIVLATKARFPTSADPNGGGSSRRHLARALEASLRRLRVDTVDLYQLHSWDPHTPIDESLAFLSDAVGSGKIRYGGISNFTGWQIQKTVDTAAAEGLARPVTVQLQYNLLARQVEWELLPAAIENGVGALIFSPLAGGILTGKYRAGTDPDADTRLSDPVMGAMYASQTREGRSWSVLEVVRSIAEEVEGSPSAVALAWLRARRGVSSILLGARTLEQLRGNLAAIPIRLSPQQIETLDRASKPISGYPYGDAGDALRARSLAGTSLEMPVVPE